MAYHHSEVVYNSKKNSLKESDNYIHKYNGSYIQQPLVDICLSSNNQVKRFVYKTKTMASSYKSTQSFQNIPGTMKIYSMKQISEETKKILRRHYRVDIKDYLVRKYNKPAYLLPLEAFQALRQVSPKQGEDFLFKTSTMYFFKPFYFLDNLKFVLDMERKAIEAEQLAYLCRSILANCLKYGGLQNFLMTSSNLYFQDNFEDLIINYTSFVGLGFVNNKDDNQFLHTRQFIEVYPHLSPIIMEHGLQISKQNLETPKYSKMRSLFINILCLFIRKNIYFNPLLQKTSSLLRKNSEEHINKLKEHFAKFLSENINIPKLLTIYGYFINQIRQISLKEPPNDQKKKRESIKLEISNKLTEQHKRFIGKQATNFKQIVEKVLVKEQTALMWEEIMDLFVDYTERKKTEEDKSVDEAFIQLHKKIWETQHQQDFYQNRGINGYRLYIPIKMNAELTLMLAYENWWEIFNEETYNFLHEPFCYKLLDAMLDIYTNESHKNADIRNDKAYQKLITFMQKNIFKTDQFTTFKDIDKEIHLLNATKQ